MLLQGINLMLNRLAAVDGSTIVVSTAWLSRHLVDPDLVIVDATVLRAIDAGGKRLWRSGRAYLETTAHIARARFADLIGDFSKLDAPFAFARPDATRFAAAAAAIGLSNRNRIVACDNSMGILAARLWWLLRAFGHDRVAVLDGGLTAWVAEGRRLERGSATPDVSIFLTREQPGFFVDSADIVAIVDGRAAGLLVCVCVLRPPVFMGAESNTKNCSVPTTAFSSRTSYGTAWFCLSIPAIRSSSIAAARYGRGDGARLDAHRRKQRCGL